MRIAILTDVHYGAAGAIARRRSEIADILLRRAVQRLNRLIKPDVTLVLGDLLDDGASSAAHERLVQLRAILDKLTSPYIVIPGNHDGDVVRFYEVFDRPNEIVDIAGVRFLPFIDAEAPGYNAIRDPVAVARFQRARSDFDGPIVALQHVCLLPPGRVDVPYNYTNASEIIAAMASAGVALSISGHHHDGAPVVRNDTTSFVTAPALCESPFGYLVVSLDDGEVSPARHQLAMPPELRLVDRHVHTQLAYCSANMDVGRAIDLSRDFGLAAIGFAEHSGHLYFDAQQYWGGHYARVGLAGASDANDRMTAYVALRQRYQDETVRFGLETDVDYDGHLVLAPSHREGIDFLLGSVHRTPSSKQPSVSPTTLADEFLNAVGYLIAGNIDCLAHPFRLFRHAGFEPPEHLFRPVARLLAQHDVAAEINFHANHPPPAFIRTCLDAGVKLSLGSDAHNLYEIGEFADHLQLLADVGFDGDLDDILLPW